MYKIVNINNHLIDLISIRNYHAYVRPIVLLLTHPHLDENASVVTAEAQESLPGASLLLTLIWHCLFLLISWSGLRGQCRLDSIHGVS